MTQLLFARFKGLRSCKRALVCLCVRGVDLDQSGGRKTSALIPVAVRKANKMVLNQPIVTKTVPAVLPRLADEQVIALAELLRLLGEPARLRVLLACVAGPASVGKIAIRAELPRALVSHHMRLLRAGQFLRATRNGKQMIYSLADERVLCILADLIGHVVTPGDDDE